jgi:hypothetical protein
MGIKTWPSFIRLAPSIVCSARTGIIATKPGEKGRSVLQLWLMKLINIPPVFATLEETLRLNYLTLFVSPA